MKVFVVAILALAMASPRTAQAVQPNPPPPPKPAPQATKPPPAKSQTPPQAAPPAPKPAPKPAANLIIALPPTAQADSVQHFLLKPYAEAGGLPLATPAWDGASLDTLKPLAPDLLLLAGPLLTTGCKSGALNHLDWNRLGRDRYQPAAITDCGAGAYQETMLLAWDPEKLQAPPNWGDFWDVARHPGRRGLPRTARNTLEIALLADGVAPNDLYRTLRTQDGQDRAFRKLDQLKPYVIWWDKPAEAAQLLATGKVLLTAAPAAAVLKAENAKRHFGLQWNASLSAWRSWAVPKDAAHAGQAALALLIAADPARQSNFAQATAEGPAARDALPLLPPTLQLAPTTAGIATDETFWAENAEKLEPRFLAWQSK
jgi:putative spermidine/putrescine transport system substrate-binding protein